MIYFPFARLVSVKLSFVLSYIFLLTFYSNVSAQAPVTPQRIPSAAPMSLTFAPDARSAAMGEAGVALSPDANSSYWNASKLPFATRDFGASVSYTPWLRNIVNDMWLGYASAYKKIGHGQVLSVSVNYFNRGLDTLYTSTHLANGYFTKKDYAINATYARQMGKNFSLGITLKYVNADFENQVLVSGLVPQRGQTLATDISAYYRKQLLSMESGRELAWTFGAVLSNLGDKINYGPGTRSDYIPTTLKVGGGLSYASESNHRFNFILDASKLLVPTPINGVNSNKPYFRGVLSSFSDAPGGLKEEIQEISLAGGVEYWYKGSVALRGGYHGENKYKGDRKFFTAGAGARILDNYCLDAAYLFPVDKGSPLAQTFRITASVYLGKNGKLGVSDKKI